jgi:GAF domain-containing protein/DNA-binding response OmpR family regulator
MSKKQLHSRLDSLFADLEQEASFLPLDGESALPGWTWESDSSGNYNTCSPEVEYILGISPKEFLGNPIHTFALHSQLSEQYSSALSAESFPIEFDVHFVNSSGELITAVLHIVSKTEGGEADGGLRGFVQITQPLLPKEKPDQIRKVEKDRSTPESIFPRDSYRKEIERREPKPSQLTHIDIGAVDWFVTNPNPSTKIGIESLLQGQMIAQPSDLDQPATMAVPIHLPEEALGLLEFLDDEPNRNWSRDDCRLVEQVADQLSLALENAHLFQSEQRRANELNTLVQLSRMISENLDLEEVYHTAFTIIGQLMSTESFTINLLNDQRGEYESVYRVENGERLPVEAFSADLGIPGYIAQDKQSFIAYNIEQEPPPFEWAVTPGITQDVRSIIAVPLQFSGEVIGVLSAQSSNANTYSEYDMGLLETFADHIAIAIQNSRLYQQEQLRRQFADALREIARVLGSTLDLHEVIERMLDQLVNLIDYNTASIQLVQKGKRQLIGGRGFDLESATPISPAIWRSVSDDPFIEEVVTSRKPLLISDTRNEPRWEIRPETSPVRCWITAPLMVGQEVVGIMTLDHTNPGAYTQETAELASAVAAQAAIAIQNARLFQQSQDTLAETETLYLASAELNTAQTYDDVLAAIRRHTWAGQGSHIVSLVFFDRPWTKELKPELAKVLAQWTITSEITIDDGYSIDNFPSLSHLLRPDAPLLVEDLINDPRLDDNFRHLYGEKLGARSALFVPIVASGRWLGFINAIYPEPTSFPENEIRRMTALVNQAGVAIQNLRNIELAEERAHEAYIRSEELALINRVVSAVVSSPDLHQVLDTMALELVDVFDVSNVDIALFNEKRDSLNVVASKSRQSELKPITGSVFSVENSPYIKEILAKKKPLLILNAQDNQLTAPIHALLQERFVENMLVAPIIAAAAVVGTVSLHLVDKTRIFSQDEIRLSETLVAQLSTAIQNANLFEQIQTALAETETLYQASAELNAVQSYSEILSIIRKYTILGHNHASNVTINLFDRPWVKEEVPDSYMPIARWANSPYTETPTTRFPMRAWTTVKQILKPETPTLIADTSNDTRMDSTARSLYIDRLDAKSLLFAPLNVGGKWFGHINSVYSQKIQFNDQEIRRLMALASQAGVAIQNIRLLEESRRRATQLETAAEIARDTSGTLALDTLLKRAVTLIRERYGYYHASIFLLDETGLNAIIRESTGEAGDEMKRRGHKLPVGSRSIIGYVTELGKPLVINDVTQDPIHRPNPLLPDTRAELGLPLKIGNRVIGAMDVQSSETNVFTPDDISVIQTLADQIAVAVDNARSYELAQKAIQETRQRVQELSVLFDVSQALATAPTEVAEIAHIISQKLVDVMNVLRCAVMLIDQDYEELAFVADLVQTRTEPDGPTNLQPAERSGSRINMDDYLDLSKLMKTLLSQVIHANDPALSPEIQEFLQQNGLTTVILMPLTVKGQVIGVIELSTSDFAYAYTPDQFNLAGTIVTTSAVALENAQLYEEQRRVTEKLREVDKLKSQFLANMSHELRTPLNSIIGFSRVILKGIDGPITELQQQDLTAIHNSGSHLLNLINNVLDISKIEAGKMELAIEDNVNLHDLINSVISTTIALVKDKPVQLEKLIQPDLPTVRADPTRIRQIILNLMSNASKFTDEGKIILECDVQDSPNGQPEVVVKVIDSGIGISPEDQKKLFLPFSQVDESPTRKTGGSGLGLSISRLLVEMHGGRIGITSEVGQGSTFYFTIPLPQPDPAKPHDPNRKTILSIDDEVQILKLYDRYLSEHGYQIVPLSDPLQAVNKAIEIKPFAITLDVMMPGRNGWQVLEMLKANPDTRDIPVIICSILEDTDKGFSLGATDYLTKPILEDDLANALNRLNGDGSIQEILVVDDDPNDLRLVERILGDKFTVRSAIGGVEGLAALRDKKPGALILDLFMPEIDGFAILENLRLDPTMQEIPVIVFTAGDLSEEQHNQLSQFSLDMLSKSSFEESELLDSINKALNRLSPPSG